jgi:hypothetical protein
VSLFERVGFGELRSYREWQRKSGGNCGAQRCDARAKECGEEQLGVEAWR